MRLTRPLAFLTACTLALLCTACGSNNKGKIEGKWKFVSLPSQDEKSKQDLEQLTQLGVYLYLDFKPDGMMTMALGADNPQVLDRMKMGVPNQKISWDARYKLLSGDKVELYDVKDEELRKAFKGEKARSDFMIAGDDMTIKDPDGAIVKLTRLKDKPAGEKAGDKKDEK